MGEAHSGAGHAQSTTNSNSTKVDARSEFERREDREDQDALDDRRRHEEWAAQLKLTPADLAVFTRNGFHYEKVPAEDTPNRRDMLAYLKKGEMSPPKWMMISGLYPDFIYSEAERRVRLRALNKALVLLIRRALGRKDVDTFKNERSIYWDPVAEVCRDLEIAQSKLSSFCREFSGHSLSQVVDCVRAEKVRKVLRAGVRAFVGKWRARGATLAAEMGSRKGAEARSKAQRTAKTGEEERWVVWGELRKSRRWPEFSQGTWALEFGFSTYRRMYRACVAVFGKTPHQMEMEMIGEVLGEVEGIGSTGSEVGEMTLEKVEEMVRGIGMFAGGT